MKKITIKLADLMTVLDKASEIASRPAGNITDNILIYVRGNKAEIVVTDKVMTMAASLDVEATDATQSYGFLLPFRYLYDNCKLIAAEDISIEIKEEKGKTDAMITALTEELGIRALPEASLFPPLPQFTIENTIGISSEFIDWLNAAILTVSSNEALPAMKKIYIGNCDHKKVAIASTNAYVLMEKTFDVDNTNPVSVLVMPKAAKALRGMKDVTLSWSASHICFEAPNMKIMCVLQAEKYVKYRSIMPGPGYNLVISHADLMLAMKKIDLTGDNATLHLKKEKGYLVLTGKDKQYNRNAVVKIPAEYTGTVGRVVITPKQMMLLLDQVKYTTLHLNIIDEKSGILITTPADDSYRGMIMPYVMPTDKK